jgi:hypothetical protein
LAANETREEQDIPVNPDNGASQSQHNHCGGSAKHMLLMILCCLTPIGLVWALNLAGYSGNLSYFMLFLCPLMHLFMMRGMKHGNK